MKNKIRAFARSAVLLSLNLGFDPRKISNIRYLPRFWRSYSEFRKKGGRATSLFPIIAEFNEDAGIAGGQYFHQDLLVARRVFEESPKRHIDIASRFDGLVTHIASFRDIEVLDIRPLRDCGHPSIRFVQADLMNPDIEELGKADSVSCLHALEHFGLGRYGDEIDPLGYERGFANVLRLVSPGGRLYVSVPIGTRRQVEFNAHRIFEPTEVFSWVPQGLNATLEAFDWVDDTGSLHRAGDPHMLPPLRNGCGIYTFRVAGTR